MKQFHTQPLQRAEPPLVFKETTSEERAADAGDRLLTPASITTLGRREALRRTSRPASSPESGATQRAAARRGLGPLAPVFPSFSFNPRFRAVLWVPHPGRGHPAVTTAVSGRPAATISHRPVHRHGCPGRDRCCVWLTAFRKHAVSLSDSHPVFPAFPSAAPPPPGSRGHRVSSALDGDLVGGRPAPSPLSRPRLPSRPALCSGCSLCDSSLFSIDDFFVPRAWLGAFPLSLPPQPTPSQGPAPFS